MVPKQYSRELLDLIFMQPYCRIETVVGAGIATRLTESTYLHALEAAGILQEKQEYAYAVRWPPPTGRATQPAVS
jgi:hypothetical protein